ncbi:hypothetical protein AC579_7443 [Pseudocercospora musae]|uniref:Secreted protein n=1 Tax=Pseudocercospora musae TaxID=113226 RepID=A0A139IQB9_9PEZI|nr:hypothetical protein AC579_7443 [Pseudocercospora musae]
MRHPRVAPRWKIVRAVELLTSSVHAAQAQDLPQVDRYRPMNLPYCGSGESISAFEWYQSIRGHSASQQANIDSTEGSKMEGVRCHGAPSAQYTNSTVVRPALSGAQSGHAHTHRVTSTGSKVLKRKYK